MTQPEQEQTGIREIRVTETVKQEQEEDWDAMGQKILVATARDTKRTWEDAAVKAVHKLMQEEQEPFTYYNPVRDAIRPFKVDGDIPLFTIPQKREWVGLTDADCKGMSAGDKLVAMWTDRTLMEKNR